MDVEMNQLGKAQFGMGVNIEAVSYTHLSYSSP